MHSFSMQHQRLVFKGQVIKQLFLLTQKEKVRTGNIQIYERKSQQVVNIHK